MKMKKRMAMALAGMMCVGMLAGCGSSTTSQTTQTNKDEGSMAATAASTDYDGKIVMLTAVKDEFLTAMDQAAAGYAEAVGCEFESIDCGNSADAQVAYTKSAVANGADALVVNLAENNTMAADIIEAAGDVPVVFVNREPSDTSVLDDTHVFVGSDEDLCGQYVGELLADYCEEQGMTEVNYLMFQGNRALIHTQKRSQGALDGLEGAGVTATAIEGGTNECGFSRSTAMETMTTLLAQGLDMSTVDVIICNNDAMAMGVIEACNQNDADLSNIAIVGVDGISDAVKAIKDGTMIGSVYQSATNQGAVGVQIAINLASGKDILDGVDFETLDDNEYWIDIPFEKIDASNAPEYM